MVHRIGQFRNALADHDTSMISRVLPGRWVTVFSRARRPLVTASAKESKVGSKEPTMYTIPQGQDGEVLEFVHEIEVKKSRFRAFGWHVNSEEEALSLIQQASDPTASHNCWAILVSGKTVRYNDDGEPGGTGGKPILSALETLNCDRSAVMVTRYFGGTKLGTGGLIRAYGGAARELLNMIDLEEMIPMRRCEVFVPAEAIGVAWSQIEAVGGQNTEGDFDEARGGYCMTFDIVDGEERVALGKLRDASRGKIVEMSEMSEMLEDGRPKG